jgi:hypothetical protein
MIKHSLIVYWVLPPSLRNSIQTIQDKTHMRERSTREREREVLEMNFVLKDTRDGGVAISAEIQ